MYADSFFYYMHFLAAVLVPFFTEWGGISFSRVLFLNSWYMFCVFIFEIPTGTVADFFGRKVSILFGSLVSMLAIVVYVSYPNFYVFLTGETIFAIAFTLKSGANEALVYDSLRMIGQQECSEQPGCSRRLQCGMQQLGKGKGIMTGLTSVDQIQSDHRQQHEQ